MPAARTPLAPLTLLAPLARLAIAAILTAAAAGAAPSAVRPTEAPAGGSPWEPEDGTAAAEELRRMEPLPGAKIAFLNYFWHRPAEFGCTMLVPRGGAIDAADTGRGGYFHRRFRRLRRAGVDVLAFAFTGFAGPDPDVDGEEPHTVRDGRNLAAAIPRALDVGLPYFIYYDLATRTAVRSKRCLTPEPAESYACRNPAHRPVSAYDLEDPVLFEQLLGDLLRIKDDLILPHRRGYYMLEDVEGRPVLDERGLPRPVLAIYVARDLTPNRGIKRLVRTVTRHYQRDGLGRPAFVLDSIFWHDPAGARVARRFGKSAAALTSFFPVNPLVAELRGIETMAGWVPAMRELYAAAAAEVERRPRLAGLQIWPGIGAMFDNRRSRGPGCEPFRHPFYATTRWHLRGREDWRAMLRMGYESARGPAARDGAASVRPLVINYENEWRESAVTDCVKKAAGGRLEYPFNFGCALLRVVAEEDRFRDPTATRPSGRASRRSRPR